MTFAFGSRSEGCLAIVFMTFFLWIISDCTGFLYFVGGNTDNKFTIDATTGWISASNLDYGTQNTYTLVIAAKDLNGANGAHETTVNVLVNVVTGMFTSLGLLGMT